MNSEAVEVAAFIIKSGYAFLTAFNIPGTNFTPLGALLFGSFFAVSFRVLLFLLKRPPSLPSSPKKSSE